ncbi:hypothetical protein brsh051_20740 [Brooklawnia propionicigenes]|uniref:Transposase n=1 Tax=Brooklawnia propionicigenes TaxID=3041175 RepID=A0AAN0K7A8_9ACTN|nr:IS630 family transposase [Brooklawnia sp. SH051]BEH02793.1 hypothetical protein brsh051_20740 [Brooklawnia sp. SH051]
MVTTSPFIIVPDPADLTALTGLANSRRAEHRQVIRARIILAAAQGHPNAAIAADLDLHVDTVRKWRNRYAHNGLAGLQDLARSGRPPVFTPVQVAQVKALACTPPADSDVPLARWSAAELAVQAVSQTMVTSVSPSTVSRWLTAGAIKPWQHRSWIFPRDPDFAAKAGIVLDLYDRRWQGAELGADDYVISADEKSQLQALHRRHPDLAPGPGRTRRVEFEYRRGGTLAYFAAYDVHHAHVIGTIAPTPASNPSPNSSTR